MLVTAGCVGAMMRHVIILRTLCNSFQGTAFCRDRGQCQGMSLTGHMSFVTFRDTFTVRRMRSHRQMQRTLGHTHPPAM